MKSLISICIPTFDRPELLCLAVQSCLMQTYRPIEILIGDDSKNEIASKLIEKMNVDEIKLFRHTPSLGQANNVNFLFDKAKGDRLVLIHDDDILEPDALERLSGCWTMHPDLDVAYGRQYIINMDGERLIQKSIDLNKNYYREAEYAGLQSSSLWAGLMGQFPNNGYMIRTIIAQTVRYNNTAEVGDICDFDFGIRVGIEAKKFYYLNDYISSYRITDSAISTNNNHANLSYSLIEQLQLPVELENFRRLRLQFYSDKAINQLLYLKNKSEAQRIYWSENYLMRNRFSVRGISQLILTFFPVQISAMIVKMIRKFRNS